MNKSYEGRLGTVCTYSKVNIDMVLGETRYMEKRKLRVDLHSAVLQGPRRKVLL